MPDNKTQENQSPSPKPKLTIGEVMAIQRAKQPREARDVDGLVNLLRKLADDLDRETAIEMDFNVEIEELAMFDHMSLSIESFHVKPDVAKKHMKPKLYVPQQPKIILE